MGFWGWRALVCSLFISVWVTGCNIVSDASPNAAPTDTPRVTLTVRRAGTPTRTVTPRVVARATTPSPTSGPGATATPRLYTIQAGDTLGDIALRFGIDIAALRDANSAVDPRALQPGETLVVPVATEPPADAPTATATPPLSGVVRPTCYETPGGDLLCLGLVANTLDFPVEQVELDVRALDADGDLLDSIVAPTEQTILAPGESAPFRALFHLDAPPADVEAVVTRADAVEDGEARFVPLDVAEGIITVVDGYAVVETTITNPGQQPTGPARAIVTVLDGDRVVGYRVAPVAQALAPGETRPVRLDIVIQAPAGSPTFLLTVEARRAE